MNLRQETTPKTEVELYCRRPLLSLQEMSLFRIATILCNNRQLIRLVMRCQLQTIFFEKLYTRMLPEWVPVQEMANELVSQMCNSKKFHKMIMEYVWPVSYRMMLWKSAYAPSIANRFMRRFYWTDKGRIDNVRTAKHIIGNKNIAIKKRFVLACSVCLSREIREIWQEMSIDCKIYFIDDRRERLWPLLLYWAENMTDIEMPDAMKEFEDDAREILNRACTCAFDNGLINAVKYFLAISTEAEKNEMASVYIHKFYNKIKFDMNPDEEMVTKIFPEEEVTNGYYLEADHLDMLYFLFFEMSHEYRFCCSSLFSVKLTLLFHFSDREHFLNTVEEELQSPRLGRVVLLLHMLFFNYHLEIKKDDDFRKIFVHIWRKIPESMRNSIAKTFMGAQYIAILIRDNFPFILRKDSFKKMSEFTSLLDWNPRTSEAPFFFHQGKWEFLHFFVEEGIVKIPILKLLKLDIICDLKIRKSNKKGWKRFLRFLRKIECRNRQ